MKPVPSVIVVAAVPAALLLACGNSGSSEGVSPWASGGSTATEEAGQNPAACAPGQSSCGSSCVNLFSDNLNCGTCGRACPAGQSCTSGVCQCTGGLLLCAGICVNSAQDPINCGACGRRCGTGELCQAGTCICQSPLVECGGLCVDTQSDPSHCGGCGVACAAGQVCSAGACTGSCAAGLTQCGQSCVDVASSVQNCGRCGVVCPAGQSCSAGTCACSLGQSLCGGVCLNTSSDPLNCGACGQACVTGQACQGGVCACMTAGQSVCGAACVDTQTDPAHCGTCGNQCSAGSTCAAGVCTSSGTGGSATGGLGTGGLGTGGLGTGGLGTGGASTGGMATGGASAGGMATGGVSSGGTATGGANTGGVSTGGSTDVCGVAGPGPLIGWASVSGNGVTTTTGGGDVEPVTVTSESEFNASAGGTTPAVLCVQGSISGDVSIGSNKTIVGMSGARFTGSVHLNSSSNVIVRNLTIVGYNCSDSPSDCSGGADAVVLNGSHHVWFDHCDVSDGSDGNLDITSASDFVTVSWTRFGYSSKRTDPVAGASGHRYSNLIGSGDNIPTDEGRLNVTFHHVWWTENVDQRMPRMRYGKIHVFNSLYTMTGNNYCIGVGMGASVLNENNVFIGANRPVNTTSFVDAASTVNSMGNIYTDITGAAVVDIGTAFDPPYDYTPEEASTVQAAVEAGVGPQ